MSTFEKIREIIVDILDVENDEVTSTTYLARELDAESIDLLEIAVSIGSEFNISVKDDIIFLRAMRQILTEAGNDHPYRCHVMKENYPHLSDERIEEMLSDLNAGPVLQIKDLESYVQHTLGA